MRRWGVLALTLCLMLSSSQATSSTTTPPAPTGSTAPGGSTATGAPGVTPAAGNAETGFSQAEISAGFTIDADPAKMSNGFTKELEITCNFSWKDNNAFDCIFSIVLEKTPTPDPSDTDWRHVASVGYNGLKTLENLGAVVTGVLVKDRLTSNARDSFINYKFRYPDQDQAIGRYKCTVGGIDAKYAVMEAVVETKVEATAVDQTMIVDKLKRVDMSKDELRSRFYGARQTIMASGMSSIMDGHRYSLSKQGWYDVPTAQMTCKRFGGKLAEIQSSGQWCNMEAYVRDRVMYGERFIVGIKRNEFFKANMRGEMMYEYLTRPNQEVLFKKWNVRPTSDMQDECVYMTHQKSQMGFGMYPMPCDKMERVRFLCEFPEDDGYYNYIIDMANNSHVENIQPDNNFDIFSCINNINNNNNYVSNYDNMNNNNNNEDDFNRNNYNNYVPTDKMIEKMRNNNNMKSNNNMGNNNNANNNNNNFNNNNNNNMNNNMGNNQNWNNNNNNWNNNNNNWNNNQNWNNIQKNNWNNNQNSWNNNQNNQWNNNQNNNWNNNQQNNNWMNNQGSMNSGWNNNQNSWNNNQGGMGTNLNDNNNYNNNNYNNNNYNNNNNNNFNNNNYNQGNNNNWNNGNSMNNNMINNMNNMNNNNNNNNIVDNIAGGSANNVNNALANNNNNDANNSNNNNGNNNGATTPVPTN